MLNIKYNLENIKNQTDLAGFVCGAAFQVICCSILMTLFIVVPFLISIDIDKPQGAGLKLSSRYSLIIAA